MIKVMLFLIVVQTVAIIFLLTKVKAMAELDVLHGNVSAILVKAHMLVYRMEAAVKAKEESLKEVFHLTSLPAATPAPAVAEAAKPSPVESAPAAEPAK